MQFCLKNCKEDCLYGFSVTMPDTLILKSANAEISTSANCFLFNSTRKTLWKTKSFSFQQQSCAEHT